MKHKPAYIILLALAFVFMFGCNDNKDFHSAYEQFWNSYYKATDFFDPDEERFETLKKLDPDLVEPELKNMKKSLDVLNSAMKTDREKSTYEDLKIVYDDLLYLVDVHDKIEGLSDDEKMDVEDKLVGVFIYRSSIEKNKD